MTRERIVVVGASAGGVRAFQELAAQLTPDFPAPILAVQHIGSYPSVLPNLLMRKGVLPAAHAEDGLRIEPGRIYVAPPDRHLLVDDGVMRLSSGPKEHHTRPAIDPLFRSAAVEWGSAAIGVLLTGSLDDGTAGLQAIKHCGGTVVVQDPADAETPSMPRSALRYVQVDHTVKLAEVGALLKRLTAKPAADARPPPGRLEQLVHETDLTLSRGDFMGHLKAIGKPSTFVCPDCNGSLWEIRDAQPPRYRCHTGHAYTLRSLQHAHTEASDQALWGALRALQEKEVILKSLAEGHRDVGDSAEAARLRAAADEIARHAQALRQLVERLPRTLDD